MSAAPAREPRALTLVRHAQAETAASDAEDRTRRLTPRGRSDADALHTLLRVDTAGVPPIDRVLCSAAVRTRETLTPLLPALGAAGREATFETALYLASADTLGAHADAAFASGARHVLLIGHNPGLERLCARLAGAPGLTMRTCERIVLSLDGAGAEPGRGTIRARAAPRGPI